MTVDLSSIRLAHERIEPFVHHTPIQTSQILDDRTAARLFFKCENFQKGGAFKARGAFNAINALDKNALRHGVVTHSSGNHGAAVALAAASMNVCAYVVMPETASRVKKAAVNHYGATVIECSATLKDRETTCHRVIEETGATFIHPYDDDAIIAGQGTAAMELFADVDGLDVVMCPVGGGGLLGGTAIAARGVSSQTRVIAAEPEGADDAKRSFDQGQWIEQTNPVTVADGLLTSLGQRNFAIIKEQVDDILTVSEVSIIHAMRLIWQHMKMVVEPSGAVPLGAILQHPTHFQGKRVGVVVSGGNVDLDKLPW